MDNGESVRELAAALDEICEKLCEKAKPLPVPDIENRQDVWEQVKRLREIVGQLWQSDLYEHQYFNEMMSMKALTQRVEKEKEETEIRHNCQLEEIRRKFWDEQKKNRDMEKRIAEYEENIKKQTSEREEDMKKRISEYEEENKLLKEKLAVYEKKKTKIGNKNAYRDDIDPSEVYRLARIEGMSISAIAKKYNVSTVTIRKRLEIGEKNRLE